MADSTGIEWCDATWSVVTGCERESPGCARCYAEQLTATRLKHQPKYLGLAVITEGGQPHWTGEIRLHPDELHRPLHWRKPRRIFVNSMSDTFHKDVPDSFIGQLFAVMESCYWHRFLILTKRHERMRELLLHDRFPMYVRKLGYDWLSPKHYQERGPFWRESVRVGVSIENQEWADRRFPAICDLAEAGWHTFVSMEPLLGLVKIPDRYLQLGERAGVILGGESGHDPRACHINWIELPLKQCQAAGVRVFVKQLGANVEACDLIDAADYFPGPVRLSDAPRPNARVHLRDPKGGDPAEWPCYLQVREVLFQ